MRFYESKAVAPIREGIVQFFYEKLGATEALDSATSCIDDELIRSDSIDLVELVMELEEEFDVTIPDDEAENIKTVGDAIDYLAKRKLS